mmetsp:Transcript_52424/g.81779  ORF Transcript_52424/g.81779 Transcript_52424/m.81779 type:complete len:85 (-) Transcript_52424:4539-4793(-)
MNSPHKYALIMCTMPHTHAHMNTHVHTHPPKKMRRLDSNICSHRRSLAQTTRDHFHRLFLANGEDIPCCRSTRLQIRQVYVTNN